MRLPSIAAALLILMPAAAHAAPVRNASPAARSEAARGGGVWLGAVAFLLAAALLALSYGRGNDAPASP